MNVGDCDSEQNGAKIGDNMSSISSGKKIKSERNSNKRKTNNTKEQSVEKEKSISSLQYNKCKMRD